MNASTASRSESPSSFWHTITVATTLGGTLRRPVPANRSANIESGNSRWPSRCSSAHIDASPTTPSHTFAVPMSMLGWAGVTPAVTAPSRELIPYM